MPSYTELISAAVNTLDPLAVFSGRQFMKPHFVKESMDITGENDRFLFVNCTF